MEPSSLQNAMRQAEVDVRKARFESSFGDLDLSEFDTQEDGAQGTSHRLSSSLSSSNSISALSASAALLQVKAREARQREQDRVEEAKLQANLLRRSRWHSDPEVRPEVSLDESFSLLAHGSHPSASAASSALVANALVGMHRSDQNDERWISRTSVKSRSKLRATKARPSPIQKGKQTARASENSSAAKGSARRSAKR